MTEKEIAYGLEKVLSEKKGEDILVVDVRSRTPIADYYLIVTAQNERHVNALKNEAIKFLEENNLHVGHVEGREESGWILVDGHDVIINIFTKSERERIRLEDIFYRN